MFSSKLAGLANGTAAGWGNLGGGTTPLLVPLTFSVINNRLHSTAFTWRLAFFVPGMLHILCGFAVQLLGRDLPDGNYRVLKKLGVKHPDKFSRVLKTAVTKAYNRQRSCRVLLQPLRPEPQPCRCHRLSLRPHEHLHSSMWGQSLGRHLTKLRHARASVAPLAPPIWRWHVVHRVGQCHHLGRICERHGYFLHLRASRLWGNIRHRSVHLSLVAWGGVRVCRCRWKHRSRPDADTRPQKATRRTKPLCTWVS